MSTQTANRKVTMYATGRSLAIPIDLKLFQGGVGLLVTFQPGVTGNCEVDVTGDPVRDTAIAPAGATGTGLNSSIANWNQHEVLFNLTASQNGNLAYPCTGVSLLVNSISGALSTGPITKGIVLTVVQVAV